MSMQSIVIGEHFDANAAEGMLVTEMVVQLCAIVKMFEAFVLAIRVKWALDPMFLQTDPGREILATACIHVTDVVRRRVILVLLDSAKAGKLSVASITMKCHYV